MIDLYHPIEIALGAIELGVTIFPCNPLNKKPLIDEWPQAASKDASQILNWWMQWPQAMIGVPTGVNGFWVLDVDVAEGKMGADSLRKLEEKFSVLPITMMVRSPTGGLHFYFSCDPSKKIKCSASEIQEHVDVRGHGGYIIWPGSRSTKGQYTIIEERIF